MFLEIPKEITDWPLVFRKENASIQRKVAEVKRMKKIIRSLCDDDSSSSEEIRPSFKPTAMNSHKTDSKGITNTIHESESSDKDSSRVLRREFSSSSENDEDNTKLASVKEHSESDTHETSMKNKKAVSNSIRKRSSKSRELRFTDTDEEKQLEKSQRYMVSKSNRKAFISLQNEEADSSSGKEFQTSKIFAKKASKAGKNEELDSSFTKLPEENTMISKKQSLCFKSRVSKIMNKFKEICYEYELRMEHVKWKHFKKDLMYQEAANNILNKSRNVINKLKMELEVQEKELVDFYTEWSKSCVQNTDHEDSSSSEDEKLPDKKKKKAPSKLRANSKEGSIVSECDSQEIFSDENTDKMNGEKDDENENAVIIENSDKSIDNDKNEHATGVTSPILGSKIDKEVPNKTQSKSSSKVVDSSDKVLETSCNKKTEKTLNESVNESVNDIFEESIIDTAPTPNTVEPSKDETTVVEDSQLQKDESKSETVKKEAVEKDSPETDGKSSVTDKVAATPVESKMVSKPVESKTVESKPVESKTVSKPAESETVSISVESETVSKPVESETVSKPVESETVSKPVESETVSKPVKSETVSKLVDTEENEKSDSSNEFDDEELAKKALLESDPETPSNDECTTVEKPVRESPKSNSKEEEKSKPRNIKSNGKKVKNNETSSSSTCKDTSSDEQTELTKLENSAKLALLDSNSDDSTDNLTDRKLDDEQQNDSDNSEDLRVKAKLLISSNSETLSDSSSDNELQTAKVTVKAASSSKHRKENKDPLDEASNFTSVGERVKKRRTRACTRSTNKNGSDKKLSMDCRVDLERLPNEVLKKHKKALEMSRHYLECKKIKSLVNVDRLQKDNESSGSSRKNLSKKKLTDKEEKDSLLNYLKELKNGEFVVGTVKDENEESNSLPEALAAVRTNGELMLEADRLTKSLLLNSDSDVEGQKDASESVDSEQEESKDKPSRDWSKKIAPKTEKDSDEEDEEKQKLNKWRRHKILTLKLTSDSDSDARREKFNKNQEKLRENADNEDSDAKDIEIKLRRKKRRKIVDSDSDTLILNSDSSSDSSVVLEDESSSDNDDATKKKKTRKRKMRKSSDTDTSFSEKKPKPKRKRIKNMSTDSDENADDDKVTGSQGSSEKKSRKNIRKVMKDKQVADDTKQAAKEEEERLKRIAERQRLYDEMYETRLANEEKLEKLVLDFDPETKEELVSVHENLVKRLKPHQAKGVKFMWDACFESLEMMKTSRGSGCIIAHCMGLGKTLQVIALAHTLLTHDKIDVNTVMVVCPLSTVLNWRNEFQLWLKDVGNDIEVYEMTKLKQNIERRYILESWQRTGGVLIIGYEMFRNLSRTNNKMRKNVKESIMRCLVDPGPDIIVCDEGHLLKNEDTALSKSMNQIKTLRRIILTGTPLQNNLIEYHCMVQFIKPNLLGTKKEFLNRFANPITNGQFDDSTEYDVKLMKKRAYVLHKMLKGCVQRFDYTVLTPFLPPKQEYVIFVSLSEVQINLYRYYLQNFARQKRTRGAGFLFTDFQSLQRIWTHPLVLQLNAEKLERINEKKFSSDSEGSLRNFIDDGSAESTSSSSGRSDEDDEVQAIDCNLPKKNTRPNPIDETTIKHEEPEVKEETWWVQFVQPEHFEDMRVSSKLLLLFGILKECEQIGDKILVFSQSLNSLTLIERFLEKIDNETQNGTNSEYLDGHTGSWSLGLDYFRLDGQTSPENRNMWCRIFNKPSNTRARLFLISTRAGGLGINLTAANRVIIFDASWNPSHDVQSIFRVYRFGQKKPCYVYRFLAAGTMEEKIYNRQVTKLSLSCRVVDVQQIERHYSNNDLTELYKFEPNPNGGKQTLNLPKDRLLAEIFLKYKNYVENYHEHDSLLENKAEEELNEEERKQAWLEYEEEKKGNQVPPASATYFQNNLLLNQHSLSALNASTDYEKLQELIRKDYPNATPAYQQMMTARVLTDMYTYWEQQTYNATNKLMTQNHMNLPNMRTPGMNIAQTSYGLQNNNPKPTTVDNDIEILPTPTTNKTNKSKEE